MDQNVPYSKYVPAPSIWNTENKNFLYKENRYRKLTPEECELMNGFDAGWTVTGMPESARYFTMVNALVVPLVERMGKMIVEIFDMKE